jgi:hypothetical protein
MQKIRWDLAKKGMRDGILHCKKRLSFFPSSAGMLLTELSLADNNSIIPGQGEFG